MTTHERYDDLATAYAFDTLDTRERQEFESHLDDCADCRLAIDDLRRVAAGLGLAADSVTPPASLRQRTLAAATRQGRERDVVSSAPTGSPVDALSRPAVTSRSPGSGWRALLAASVALALGLGTYAVMLRSQVQDLRELLAQSASQSNRLREELAAARVDRSRLTRTVNVLSAPDVLRVDLRGQSGASASGGRAFVSNFGLIFSAQGLPALPAGRTYQLWVIPAGAGATPVGAGTFDLDSAGRVAVSLPLPDGVPAVAAVAVTAEPAGGSASPTSPILLLGTAAPS